MGVRRQLKASFFSYPAKVVLAGERLPHAQGHEELLRHLLLSEGDGAGGDHHHLAAFVLQFGHLGKARQHVSGSVSTGFGLTSFMDRFEG